MKIYIFRHGNPDYQNDSLTDLGKKEAIALGEHFCNSIDFDKVYVSTQGRAILTYQLATKDKHYTPIMSDWCREDLGARYMMVNYAPDKWTWGFFDEKTKHQFRDQTITKDPWHWYDAPEFRDQLFKQGVEIMNKSVDEFFKENNYIHDRDTRTYKVAGNHPKNIAIFAHGGFSVSFLSSVLDIPYCLFTTSITDPDTTGIMIVEIPDEGDKVIAKLMAYNLVDHKKYI